MLRPCPGNDWCVSTHNRSLRRLKSIESVYTGGN
nr:MAG TPA: hypothetical protein [Caudoviricetes sp.]